MKLLLAACLLGLVGAQPTYEPIMRYYHESHGVQQAARIKASEEATDFDGSRIIGGTVTSLGQYPYVAGLVITLTSDAASVCGGALVSNTRVLTAASCWWDGRSLARGMVVVLASRTLFSGGTRRSITNVNVALHPDYDSFNLRNNIAAITIPHTAYTSNLRNIVLPGINEDNNVDRFLAVAAGYGKIGDNNPITTSQALRHVTLRVMANVDCQLVYGTDMVVASNLCTEGSATANICYGDIGTSLGAQRVANAWRLIGIASFWAAAGCQRGLPSGFTRVSSYITWIQAQL